MMRIHRRILTIVATGLLAVPLAAESQQAGVAVPRIGYLGSSSPSLEPHYVEAFRQRLHELGYFEGQNVAIEYRWAEGHDDQLPGLAADLVRLNPNVIVTTGTPSAFAAKQATKTIPIVMASSGDPVRSGLVASLAHPGENVTGFTVLGPELEGKRLELLKEAVPRLSRVAVLWNPANPAIRFYYEAIRAAAGTLHVKLEPVVEVRRVEELETAFSTIARARPQALAVLADRFLLAHRRRIVGFAAARRLPGMYPYREYADAGGLMSYAPSNTELFRGAAGYVDRILKGANPGDLPVQEPTKFDFVINVKTAGVLGLTIPPSMLAGAELVR
jgi:putative ABC transport system substrate-binding protein